MKRLFSFFLLLFVIKSVNAQQLRAHIVDVGAGLCVIITMPPNGDEAPPWYMIYDTGHNCIEEVQSTIPSDRPIDLMVLSHNDSDHIGGVDEILDAYQVNKIIWTGFKRPGIGTWNETNDAINNETGAEVVNLEHDHIPIGATERYGDTYVSFVAGFNVPPSEWGIPQTDVSTYRNAGSIVMRLVYHGKSLLLTGDIVGRELGEDFPDQEATLSEKYLVENRFAVPIRSDVLVAPHHGSDGASSYPFIRAVDPEYVIFSAGSQDLYGHPRASTAQRYLNSGVPLDHIFRTDLGDDENHIDHWEYGAIEGNSDPSGDDDVLITIDAEGVVSVSYEDI